MGQLQDPDDNNVIPEILEPQVNSFRTTCPDAIGKTVSIKGIPGSYLKTCSSPKEKELPSEIPLILQVRSLSEGYGSMNMNALWLFCNVQL